MDTLTCAVCGASFPVRELDHSKTLRCLRCGGSLRSPSAIRKVELPPALPEAAKPPDSVGRYRLVRRIGSGGNGVVYEAVHPDTRARVAVKILLIDPSASPAEAEQDRQRFARESKVCLALPPHPHVVPLRDAGVADHTYFFVMELVDGAPLHEWRRIGPPPLRRQLEVLRDVALGLEHVHAHGIIHRDLKPENVLVDREGRPRLTDFGLARLVDASGAGSTTGSSVVVGTPTYVSPEQALKPGSVDRRTDVFSLGVMLYETLTGMLPFTGKSTVGILMSVMNDTPLSPSKTQDARVRGVDAAMDALCLQALAKSREERFASAGAFARALDGWLNARNR
jgi:serine/threonine protein kinase